MVQFAVQTRGLSKVYKAGEQDLPVLRGVDLDIRAGEYVSIMGPRGSGKSTLLNLIGLLDAPTSGAIRLVERETHRLSATESALLRRRALGFVPMLK